MKVVMIAVLFVLAACATPETPAAPVNRQQPNQNAVPATSWTAPEALPQ